MHMRTAAMALALFTMLAGDSAAVPRLNKPSEGAKVEAIGPPRAETAPDPLAQRRLGTTPCTGGSAGGYPCSNVDLLAFLPLSSIGAGGNPAADIWGWTHAASGREFALVGLANGTSFVEITNPTSPVYVGRLPTHTSINDWRDIKVFADHAFIVSEASGHGVQIFDLTQLLSVGSPPVTFSNTAHYSGFGSAHNIVMNEDTGFAYGVGAGSCSGGLHMIDVNDPLNPTFAGCFSSDGYTHDAQVVTYHGPDADHQGKEIALACNEDTITIVDVTNKGAPVQLSRTGYSGSSYTHQGWLTENHRFFLMNDEGDETGFGHNTRTRVFNVTDLDNIVFIGSYNGPTSAIDHNLYVRGNYTFEANYRAGLRILVNTNVGIGSLSQVGYFDVYPTSNSANFNGAWSVYPYFPSGTIVVSGIEQGLFVLDGSDALGGGSIAGTVTDGVSPLTGATLRAVDGGSGMSITGGAYSIDLLLPGTYTVEASKPGFEPASTGGVVVTNGGTTSGIDFVLSPGSASISGRALLCGETDHSGVLIAATGGFSDVTDSNGNYSITGLISGSYNVTASKNGFGSEVTNVSLSVGQAETGVDFDLLPSGVVQFTDSPSLAIPDNNATGVTATLFVPSSVVPSEVDVDIDISHTWIGDLVVELESPLGTTVRLHDRSGGSSNDINTIYDDFTAPDGPGTMADFANQEAQGTWKLHLSDHESQDAGVLNTWTLELAAADSCEPATDAPNVGPPAASAFALSAPRPNPTAGDTRVAFTLATPAQVALSVYDTAGRRVATLVDGPQVSGAHVAAWDGRDSAGRAVASGVYFVRMEAAGFRAMERVTLLR